MTANHEPLMSFSTFHMIEDCQERYTPLIRFAIKAVIPITPVRVKQSPVRTRTDSDKEILSLSEDTRKE